jgi:hypothetical protein
MIAIDNPNPKIIFFISILRKFFTFNVWQVNEIN